MDLKQRLALYFSILFFMVMAMLMILIYTLFSNFRKEEFRDRLEEKASNTIMLLLRVKEVDRELLKIIDKNTIQKLYNERVLIFDQNFQLIYSSLDDAPIKWTRQELSYLKKVKNFFTTGQKYDLFGMYYDFENEDYFVLVAAEDKYGFRKLVYLRYLLISAFIVGTALVWLFSLYLGHKALKPLDELRRRIAEISDKNLSLRIPENAIQDEISSITRSFNEMLDRIEQAYIRQKRFTANASHELRTPVARMTANLDRLIRENKDDEYTHGLLKEISMECYQLSDIITSLMVLSKLDKRTEGNLLPLVRIDEVVFKAAEQFKRLNHDLRFEYEIEQLQSDDILPEVHADESLLIIALNNLISNGYKYSTDKVLKCRLTYTMKSIELTFDNKGPLPNVDETENLFNAFIRGSNVSKKPGIGMGLSIVQRIIHYHQADIQYKVSPPDINSLIIRFPLPV